MNLVLMDLKHDDGSHRKTVEVSLHQPPAVVRPDAGDPITMNWERAIDDELHLRHCPVCSGPDLYAKKRAPQLTIFAGIVLCATVVMVLFGIGQVELAIVALVILVAADIGVHFYAGRELVCYRCRTQFRKLRIGRKHARWNRELAERYREQDRRDQSQSSTSTQEQTGAAS